MNFKLQKPDMLAEAQKAGGKAAWLECLQMLGVFLLAEIGIFLCSLPFTAIGFFFSDTLKAYAALHGEEALFSMLETVNMVISLFLQLPALLIVLVFCKKVQKRKSWTLGFKKQNWLQEYGVGMLAGFGLMTLAAAIAWICGVMQISFNREILQLKMLGLLLLYFLGFLIQGMMEEVLCRGYFLISLARKSGNLWMAILVSSLFFAALHLLNAGITLLSFVNLTLFGIFAGVYFLKRGNLWGIGALHSLWNFTQGNVWGVLVSGMHSGPSLFTAEATENMPLLSGGSFGLEGSLITTIILIAATLVMLRLPQRDTVPEAPSDSE